MESTHAPLVSVIMPVYNGGALLPAALESVRAQTVSDFELLLIDDGSTDGSREICQNLAQADPRVRFFSQPNAGICAARNRGMEVMRGRWFTFCDDDDRMRPDALEILLRAAASPGVDLVRTGYRLFRENAAGRAIELAHPAGTPVRLCPGDGGEEYLNFLQQSGPQFVWNALYRRRVFGALRFDETCRSGLEDFIFNAQALSLHRGAVYDPAVTYEHGERQTGTSACASGQAVETRLAALPRWAAAERTAAQAWCAQGERSRILSCRQAELVTFAMHQIRDGKLSHAQAARAWGTLRLALVDDPSTPLDIFYLLRQNKKHGIALILFRIHLQGLYSCLPNREEKLLNQ